MSLTRIFTVAALAISAISTSAHAADYRPFNRAEFEAAKAAGKPVLVDVKAWWCPVCASQNRTIKQTVTSSHAYDHVTIFELNYDKQKPEWKALGVNKQGTLIGYKKGKEVGRIQFKTDKTEINSLLQTLIG